MSVIALAQSARSPVFMSETLRLGMQHLCPSGLSEQWLLRDCGDRHWGLIARALGQERAVFQDASGRAVYAAFCATSVTLVPPLPLLGETVELRSELFAVSAARIGSVHRVALGAGQVARVEMISTFVSHDDSGSNRRILRNAPVGRANLPEPPSALAALDERAREVARGLRDRTPRAAPILTATPVPALDFNAVGLLYFPTFSGLAEMARPAPAALLGRDVIYMGNIDMGDRVRVHEAAGGLDIVRPDDRIIAHVQSRYQPSG